MNSPIVSVVCGDGSECHVVVQNKGEYIGDWIEAFRRLLAFQGFHHESINGRLGE